MFQQQGLYFGVKAAGGGGGLPVLGVEQGAVVQASQLRAIAGFVRFGQSAQPLHQRMRSV